MTSVDLVSKSSEAVGGMASGIYTIANAKGDWKQIVTGVLEIVNALAVFLPPPASTVTSTISSIAALFLGGESTDTNALIQSEFEKQTELILDEFTAIREHIDDALDIQFLEEMYILAQVFLIIHIIFIHLNYIFMVCFNYRLFWLICQPNHCLWIPLRIKK